MGKRTAAEADVVDRDDDVPIVTSAMPSFSLGSTAAAVGTSDTTRGALLESPVPFAWQHIPDRSMEPRGACHTRVRAAARSAKQSKPPLPSADESSSEHGDDDDERDHMTELSMALPPLVAPRPRRVVSPDLIFLATTTSVASGRLARCDDHSRDVHDHTASVPRPAFRPIGAGRPDVETTSPPPRAGNPVVLDARFKNMQRLDLALDARDAPLQPFHRPCAQRRVVINAPAVVPVVFAQVSPLPREATTTIKTSWP